MEDNLLFQLKKGGLIDEMIFGFSTSLDEITLGGWDQSQNQNPYQEMKTLKLESNYWRIPMLPQYKVGFLNDIDMSSTKYVMLDFAFPYIYIPSGDFESYSARIT